MSPKGNRRNLSKRLDGHPHRLQRPGVHHDVACPYPDCERRIDRTKLTQHVNSQHRPPQPGQ